MSDSSSCYFTTWNWNKG